MSNENIDQALEHLWPVRMSLVFDLNNDPNPTQAALLEHVQNAMVALRPRLRHDAVFMEAPARFLERSGK